MTSFLFSSFPAILIKIQKNQKRNKIKSFLSLVAGSGIAFVGYNLYDGNDKFYDAIYKNILPIAHKWIAPEFAHFVGKCVHMLIKFKI